MTACGSGSTRNLGSLDPGDSGGTPAPPPPPPLPDPEEPPPVTEVSITGSATFDRVPFNATAGEGLDYSAAAVRKAPARGITVNLIRVADNVNLMGTTTDAQGRYTFESTDTITITPNTQYKIQMMARMVKRGAAPRWDFRVCDNTIMQTVSNPTGPPCADDPDGSGNAMYTYEEEFNSGTAPTLVKSVSAVSGWNGAAYGAARPAAPFAALDVIYDAHQLVLSAEPTAVLPQLKVFWSAANTTTFVDDLDNAADRAAFYQGAIGVTYYENNRFSNGNNIFKGIYVLGDENVDTDEFDRAIIARAFGSYYLETFGKDDSIQGLTDDPTVSHLDARVAFSEGFADAFAGMLYGPDVRDSYDPAQGTDDAYDLEGGVLPTVAADLGWFNEGTVAATIYDLFDTANDADDTVTLGFAPIHAAIKRLDASVVLNTIYSFSQAVRTGADATVAANIVTLLAGRRITALDEMGTGEIHAGGSTTSLPLYTALVPGVATNICTTESADFPPDGVYNELGARRLLYVVSPQTGTLTVTTVGAAGGGNPAAVDTGVEVFWDHTLFDLDDDGGAGSATVTVSAIGRTYIAEVYHLDAGGGTRCMNVTATFNN